MDIVTMGCSPCCGELPPCCDGCAGGHATAFDVTFGTTDGPCLACLGLNGTTIRLTENFGGCFWTLDSGFGFSLQYAPDSGLDFPWQFVFGDDGTCGEEVFVNDAYTGEFTCGEGGVFHFFSHATGASASCGIFDSITITPVDPYPCDGGFVSFLGAPPEIEAEDSIGASQGPSFFRKGMNYLQSTAKHVANRMRLASPEVQQQRLALCFACPSHRDGVCHEKKCGCPVAKKVARASESCPIGKWQAVPRGDVEL